MTLIWDYLGVSMCMDTGSDRDIEFYGRPCFKDDRLLC